MGELFQGPVVSHIRLLWEILACRAAMDATGKVRGNIWYVYVCDLSGRQNTDFCRLPDISADELDAYIANLLSRVNMNLLMIGNLRKDVCVFPPRALLR